MVLERGDIQFFFQPSVQPAEAAEYRLGVQSLFAILSPAGGEHRRLRIGKKRLPSRPRDRFWARIERVGSLQRVLGDKLDAEIYTTKTRGTRFQPGARPIARGSYEFVRHEDHTHFVYDLEPFDFEDAPEELALPSHGDHLILFENERGTRPVWTAAGDVASLDREGYELVLAGGHAPP